MLSPGGHSRRGCCLRYGHCAFTFLRPFAPRALPRFHATTDALTAAQHSPPDSSPCFTSSHLPDLPSPTTAPRPTVAFRSCRFSAVNLLPLGCFGNLKPAPDGSSGLRPWSAGSSLGTAESRSSPTDGQFVSRCSPPVLANTQLRSTTRSAGWRGADFHRSDEARLHAHGPRPARPHHGGCLTSPCIPAPSSASYANWMDVTVGPAPMVCLAWWPGE